MRLRPILYLLIFNGYEIPLMAGMPHTAAGLAQQKR